MNTQSELKTLASDWDKTTRLMASLERYQQILAGATEASADVSMVMSTALENIDPEFDIKEGSTITLRAIKEALSVAAKTAWEIIKQIWQYLNALYVRFTGSIRRVRGNQQTIMKRLGKLGSKTSYSSNISVAGVQRLSVDGKFVGVDSSNLEDIKGITNYILNVYPKSVTQIARNCSRQFLNILDREDDAKDAPRLIIEQFAEIYAQHFREPPNAQTVKQGEVSGQSKNLKRSPALVSNSAFVYVDPNTLVDEIQRSKSDTAKVVSDSLYMSFAELSLNVADKSEREIDLPSVKDMIALTEEIARILTLAERAESGRRDFATVKTVVDDAIRQIMDSTDEKGTVPASSLAITIIGEISKKLAEPMDNFTHWLAITLNVWLNFIGHCISHYENEGV